MKTKLVLLALFIVQCTQLTKAQLACNLAPVPIWGTPVNGIILDIVADFGAIPNDGQSDQAAFEVAFQFFQQNIIGGTCGHGQLNIPPGVYDVGQQDLNCNGQYQYGHQVFTLTNADDFAINGSGLFARTIIRYEPCLKYGSFDPHNGGRYLAWSFDPNNPGFNNPAYLASVNNCFEFIRSSNIGIRNIELDGNVDEMEIGGYWSSDYSGIQATYDGIYLESSYSISLLNVYVHHFGRDGVHIDADPGVPFILTKIVDSRFDSNCRNGMTWAGGAILDVTKTHFNLNGWGNFTTSHGSGISIDWASYNNSGVSADIAYGSFYGVSSVHNYNAGLDAKENPANSPFIYSFNFDQCNFIGSFDPIGNTFGPAALPGLRQALYSRCGFYGYTNQIFANPNYPSDGPDFNDCTFSDAFQNLQYCSGNWDWIVNMPLVGPCQRDFNRCRFERHCTDVFGYFVGGDIIMDQCNFYDYSSPTINYTGVFCGTTTACSLYTSAPAPWGTWCNGLPFASTFPNPVAGSCSNRYKLPFLDRFTMDCKWCHYPDGLTLDAVECYRDRDGDKRLALNNTYETQSRIFPNPATDEVTISNLNVDDVIIIRDVFGKEVQRAISNGSQLEINISKLNPGMYYISSGEDYIGKMIKQ